MAPPRTLDDLPLQGSEGRFLLEPCSLWRAARVPAPFLTPVPRFGVCGEGSLPDSVFAHHVRRGEDLRRGETDLRRGLLPAPLRFGDALRRGEDDAPRDDRLPLGDLRAERPGDLALPLPSFLPPSLAARSGVPASVSWNSFPPTRFSGAVGAPYVTNYDTARLCSGMREPHSDLSPLSP